LTVTPIPSSSSSVSYLVTPATQLTSGSSRIA
jgi:hypothetical protein